MKVSLISTHLSFKKEDNYYNYYSNYCVEEPLKTFLLCIRTILPLSKLPSLVIQSTLLPLIMPTLIKECIEEGHKEGINHFEEAEDYIWNLKKEKHKKRKRKNQKDFENEKRIKLNKLLNY